MINAEELKALDKMVELWRWLYEYENKWEKEIEKGLVEVGNDSLGD